MISLVLIWDNLKNSLRTKKAIVFLILYLAVFGLIMYAFFYVQENIERQLSEQGFSDYQRIFITGFGRSIIRNNIENEAVVNFLFSVPPINIIMFFVTLIGTPLLLFILNYDKVSQEIYDGTIRYFLFRVSRFQLYSSKFLSSVIECAAITFIALFLGILWASIRYRSVDFVESIGYGLRYWLIAQFFLVVFIAFSLMASSIFKKPFVALIVSFVSYLVMAVIPFFVAYVSPYDAVYFEGLFFNNSPQLFISLAAYLGFAAVFLTTGYLIFKRADL